MNKELEAFENIMRIYGETNSLEGTYDDFLTIKKALQRLEQIDNAKPSEALESWNKIGDILNKYCNDKGLKFSDQYNIGQELQIIKQYLLKEQEQEKVLEIIKKKQVDVCELKICIDEYDDSLYQYNKRNIEKFKLTLEEFDTLKRWLENDTL